MRVRLYGTLGALVAFVALAVALGETRGEGAITGWEVLLAVAAVAAMIASAALAALALACEVRWWWRGRNARA